MLSRGLVWAVNQRSTIVTFLNPIPPITHLFSRIYAVMPFAYMELFASFALWQLHESRWPSFSRVIPIPSFSFSSRFAKAVADMQKISFARRDKIEGHTLFVDLTAKRKKYLMQRAEKEDRNFYFSIYFSSLQVANLLLCHF